MSSGPVIPSGLSGLSPIHFSKANGVHADIGAGPGKIHVPYSGQATLDMFIKRKGSYAEDKRMFDLGGKLHLPFIPW